MIETFSFSAISETLPVGRTWIADDQRVGCGCEHDIRLVDPAGARVDDLDPDLLVGKLFERFLEGLRGAVHVGLDDDP